MKKLLVIMALAAFLAATSGTAFSEAEDTNPHYKGQGKGIGPAPCSGDGIDLGYPWDLTECNPDE